MTARLDRVAPDVLQLASLCSLATRIEPQLLRYLRLELAPHLHPGVEADLWFSPLVAQAATTGIILHHEVVEPLRARLKDAGPVLDRAWEITSALHREGSTVLHAEEELAWLATRGISTQTEVARAQELLRRLLATLIDEGSAGMVNWAERAVIRLPEAVFSFEEARLLALAASYRGATTPPAHAGRFPASGQSVPWLMPREERRRALGVRLVVGGIEFGPADLEGMHLLDLPPGRDIAITVSAHEERGWRRLDVAPVSGRTTLLPFDATEYRITIRGGEGYTLRVPKAKSSFVKRVQSPRVLISYEDHYDSSNIVSLPFVLGIIAPLLPEFCSGNLAPWYERSFEDISDLDVDALMARIAPTLVEPFQLTVPDAESKAIKFSLSFRKIEDFSPDAIVQAVPELQALLDLRETFLALAGKLDTKSRLRLELNERLATSQHGSNGQRKDLRQWLVDAVSIPDRFVENCIPVLTSAVASGGDILVSLSRAADAQDALLSQYMNGIIHRPDFEELEAAWRSLQYLTANVGQRSDFKLKVLPCSMTEVAQDFAAAEELSGSHLYKSIIEFNFGQLGGEPFSLVMIDDDFQNFAENGSILKTLADLGEAASCPIIANASPRLMGFERWSDLATQNNNTAGMAQLGDDRPIWGYSSVREQHSSKWFGLCMPRVAIRIPYSPKVNPVTSFAFDDISLEPVMMHASYPFAVNVVRAHAEYGWPVRIRGVQTGGQVDTLQTYMFPTDTGGIDLRCTTEVALSDRTGVALANAGLMPLVHRPSTNSAAFISAQSLYKPKTFSDPHATAADHISSRLPCMFAAAKFVTTIRCMVRDKIGTSMDAPALEKWINTWLLTYVSGDPSNSSEAVKARQPLASASFSVIQDGAEDGFRHCQLDLRPIYQIDGGDIGLSVTFKMPGVA